jgi:hypothetical protein
MELGERGSSPSKAQLIGAGALLIWRYRLLQDDFCMDSGDLRQPALYYLQRKHSKQI